MPWQPLPKSKKAGEVSPNLQDYAEARAAFSWELAARELDGLPGGRGLNIAHESVDRHAACRVSVPNAGSVFQTDSSGKAAKVEPHGFTAVAPIRTSAEPAEAALLRQGFRLR